MDSINVELINKNILMKSKKYNNEDTNNDKYNKTIKIYDFFSINEINITNKIIQINNYKNKFDVLNNYIFIKVKKNNKEIINQLNQLNKIDNQLDNQLNNQLDNTINKTDNKYILITYNNFQYLYFDDFLFNLASPKLFILHILDSYPVLINSLIKLNEYNICFFNLSPKTVIFSQNFVPLIRKFNKSICIEKIEKEEYISTIIKNIKDYTYKPLEVHVLFYLIIKNNKTLSYSLIDSICENYIKNMNILDLFSQSYRENYKSICIEYLKQYINKSKIEIISDILKYIHTWDNYSLSIIYLYIIGNISKVFSLKDNFMNKFIIILSKNIYPNPLKREILQNTFNQYNNLYEEFTDWSFVNIISKEKLKELYKVILN